jgi:hypothetical protein
VAKGKHRVTHPPVQALIAVVVGAVIVVLVSLAIGSLFSVTRVEPTFPDPVPLFAMGPAEHDVDLVQSA